MKHFLKPGLFAVFLSLSSNLISEEPTKPTLSLVFKKIRNITNHAFILKDQTLGTQTIIPPHQKTRLKLDIALSSPLAYFFNQVDSIGLLPLKFLTKQKVRSDISMITEKARFILEPADTSATPCIYFEIGINDSHKPLPIVLQVGSQDALSLEPPSFMIGRFPFFWACPHSKIKMTIIITQKEETSKIELQCEQFILCDKS